MIDETQLITAMMVSSDKLSLAVEAGMESGWFEFEAGKNRFESLCGMLSDGEWSVTNFTMVIQKAGLTDLFRGVMEFSQAEDWFFDDRSFLIAVDCFRDQYMGRQIVNACNSAVAFIELSDDPYDVKESLLGRINELDSVDSAGEFTTDQIAEEAFAIDTKIASGQPLGLPFPWEAFQNSTFGIPYGTVCPLAGRDKKGKSRLSAFLAYSWISKGIPIAYFPFEDRRHRFLNNLAAAHGGYDLFTIKNGYVSERFMTHHRACQREVAAMPIHIYDTSSTIEQICAKIRKYKRTEGIQGCVLDGFKDIIATKGENRTQQENHMMSTLVNTCGDTEVACVPVMHINKIDHDIWITPEKITGSGKQTQSARMRLFFQDAGFGPGALDNVATDHDRVICLDCDAASYGNPAKILLEKNLEQGRFEMVERIGTTSQYSETNK